MINDNIINFKDFNKKEKYPTENDIEEATKKLLRDSNKFIIISMYDKDIEFIVNGLNIDEIRYILNVAMHKSFILEEYHSSPK